MKTHCKRSAGGARTRAISQHPVEKEKEQFVPVPTDSQMNPCCNGVNLHDEDEDDNKDDEEEEGESREEDSSSGDESSGSSDSSSRTGSSDSS